MSKEKRGYLYQEYEPTPDKPCEIQGKNLLEDGELIIRRVPIKYVDDYVKLQNNWNELKKWLEEEIDYCSGTDDMAFISMKNAYESTMLEMQELEGNNE